VTWSRTSPRRREPRELCAGNSKHACAWLCLTPCFFIYGFTLPLQKWLLYIPVQHLRPQVEILLDYMTKRGMLPTSNPNLAARSIAPWVSHHEPLLFFFFVGACAEQVSDEAGKRPELLVDARWHSTRFIEVAHLLGLRTWKEAQRVLKRFVYQEGVMGRFVEGLFAEPNPIQVSLRGSLLV